jgi:hypothetical protein
VKKCLFFSRILIFSTHFRKTKKTYAEQAPTSIQAGFESCLGHTWT